MLKNHKFLWKSAYFFFEKRFVEYAYDGKNVARVISLKKSGRLSILTITIKRNRPNCAKNRKKSWIFTKIGLFLFVKIKFMDAYISKNEAWAMSLTMSGRSLILAITLKRYEFFKLCRSKMPVRHQKFFIADLAKFYTKIK
jgi:hypothetical protein